MRRAETRLWGHVSRRLWNCPGQDEQAAGGGAQRFAAGEEQPAARVARACPRSAQYLGGKQPQQRAEAVVASEARADLVKALDVETAASDASADAVDAHGATAQAGVSRLVRHKGGGGAAGGCGGGAQRACKRVCG